MKNPYKAGMMLTLINNDFNNWRIGVTVIVKSSNDNQYLVKNDETGDSIWVNPEQVKLSSIGVPFGGIEGNHIIDPNDY